MRMSMFALLVPALLAAPSVVCSQTTSPHNALGFIGAVNMAKVSGGGFTRSESILSYSVGAFVRVPMSGPWSFQPELEYAGKGNRVKGTIIVTGAYTEIVDIQYLEFPLLVHLATPATPSGRVFLEAGPAPAMKVACNAHLVAHAQSVPTTCAKLGLDANSFDLGALVGVGLELPVDTHAIWAGVRYDYGLLDVADGSNARNLNLQIVGGFVL